MSDYLKYSIYFFLTLVFLIDLPHDTEGQRRITYETLARQQRQQDIFFDNFTLPASKKNNAEFVTAFRINYNFLPFKKAKESVEKIQFFSSVSLSIEVFEQSKSNSGKKDEEISVKGLKTVARSFWQDTAYAASYDETQSSDAFIEGSLTVTLPPGDYSYVLQLKKGDEKEGQTSRKRNFRILPYQDKRQGNMIFVDSFQENPDRPPGELDLTNFGNNVFFGEDFYVFVHLPQHRGSDSYQIKVNQIDIGSEDTTFTKSVYSSAFTGKDVYENLKPALDQKNGKLHLNLATVEEGEDYYIHKIPNSKFQNGAYRIIVSRNGQKNPVSVGLYRSRWLDMPRSLLNVDVAIDMLRFIVDEKTIKNLKSGNQQEKERKFREFWKQRDPTPNTEFNELMAEYYRRVDYTYDKFSTVNVNGYNTDRGEIYIKYGAPKNIERKFPAGEPAVEIWTYGENRTFVFRAVSGFGDFELVRNSN